VSIFIYSHGTEDTKLHVCGLPDGNSVANRPGQPSVRRWPSLRAEARAGLKQPGPAPASNHPDWAAWLHMQDGPVGPVGSSLAQSDQSRPVRPVRPVPTSPTSPDQSGPVRPSPTSPDQSGPVRPVRSSPAQSDQSSPVWPSLTRPFPGGLRISISYIRVFNSRNILL